MQRTSLVVFITILINVMLSVTLLIYISPSHYVSYIGGGPTKFDTEKISSAHPFTLWESKYRNCVIKTFSAATVELGKYGHLLDICNAEYVRQVFGVKYLPNRDDTKLAIPPW